MAGARGGRARRSEAGSTGGSGRSEASGSGAVLAADRARTLVAALARAGVPDARIDIATALRPGRRAVIVTLAFAGDPSVASQGKRP